MSCLQKLLSELGNHADLLERLPDLLQSFEARLTALENKPGKKPQPKKFRGAHPIETDYGDIIRGLKYHGFNVSNESLQEILSVNQHQIGAARAYLLGKLKDKLCRPIPYKKVVKEWLRENSLLG